VVLPKLGKEDIYFLKFKWPEMNTKNAHLKGECPKKDLLMLEDHEGGRKNMKITHLENSSSRKKMKNKMI
jgi:hypothetical protein